MDVLPKNPKRRLAPKIVAVVAVFALGALTHALVAVPGVGRFRSTAGQQAYQASYDRAMRDLPSPAATMDLQTTFGRVRVYEFRSGLTVPGEVPVVLLPGRTSGVPMWQQNLPDFAATRTTYAIDALGDAGMSVQTSPLRDAADQADWLDQVLAQLPAPTVHLVGHSFGGWLAANYATRHPERVQTLTLLEPVFVFQGLRWQVYAASMPASLPFLPKRWREAMLRDFGGGPVDLDDPVTRMISDATEHYASALPQPTRIIEAQLAGWPMPVYAALAENSFMHDAAAAAEVAQTSVRDATVRLWPGTTHSLPMERSAPLDREVLTFMAAHDR